MYEARAQGPGFFIAVLPVTILSAPLRLIPSTLFGKNLLFYPSAPVMPGAGALA
jgi:hypothetical protein